MAWETWLWATRLPVPRPNGRSFIATGTENFINQRQSKQRIGRTIMSAATPGRGFVYCRSHISISYICLVELLALLLVEKGVDERFLCVYQDIRFVTEVGKGRLIWV